jgi:hypothetical protein
MKTLFLSLVVKPLVEKVLLAVYRKMIDLHFYIVKKYDEYRKKKANEKKIDAYKKAETMDERKDTFNNLP